MSDKNRISINAHSSIRIKSDKATVYFDPFKIDDDHITSDADVIFITHDHYDHYSPEDIEKVINFETYIVCPKSIAEKVMADGYEEDFVIPVEPGKKYKAAGIEFETVPAYNIGKKFHPQSNRWVGYVVKLNGQRIYVAGDTDALPENESIKCDVALVPIGGTYTMNADEAATFINKMKPKMAIPTHYGSIVGDITEGKRFCKLIDPEIETKTLIKKPKLSED